MNRKRLFLTTCFLFATASLFADRIIDPLKLPNSILQSVQQWFPGETVTLAESDWGAYSVRLSNGASIDFSLFRNWEEISSPSGLPATALPSGIFEAAAKAYPEALILKIEREHGGYEVQLSNRMNLYFTKGGRLIGREFDD